MVSEAMTRGARLLLAGTIAVEPWQRPPAGPGDAVVRVLASGICGTDVEIYRGGVEVPAGRVLGHEGAGVVELVPPGSSLEPGAPVVVDPAIACGGCAVCRDGLPNLCPNGGLLGRELDGLFADEANVPAPNLHPLPDAVPLADAPLLQVLATVVHAQSAVEPSPGRLCAVVGLGCAGQLHAQLLAHRGGRVLGVTRGEAKRRLAAELACEWTAAPDEAEPLARELAPLGGAELVVEAAGTPDALDLAVRLVRPGGTVLAYGIQTHAGPELSLYRLYRKEVRLLHSRASLPHDLPVAIELAATGAVRLAPLVSDRLPLAAAGEALERSAAGALKVVLEH
ncbi:MAG TPA: alcohol dehydrogenase catalytic domain-containing protein [Gaiellaceae bacterium]